MRRSLVMLILCLTLCAAFAANVHPIYAASITFATICEITGAPGSHFGTITVSPVGSYSYSYSVNNTTTGKTFGDTGTSPGGTGPFSSGNVIVHAGDVILVTLSLSTGDSASVYPCGKPSSPYIPPAPVFSDDRLNNNDAGQTVAVYCEADGSVKVLHIWQRQAYAAILASPDEIAKVPKNPTGNTVIKSGNGATLYRLMG